MDLGFRSCANKYCVGCWRGGEGEIFGYSESGVWTVWAMVRERGPRTYFEVSCSSLLKFNIKTLLFSAYIDFRTRQQALVSNPPLETWMLLTSLLTIILDGVWDTFRFIIFIGLVLNRCTSNGHVWCGASLSTFILLFYREIIVLFYFIG